MKIIARTSLLSVGILFFILFFSVLKIQSESGNRFIFNQRGEGTITGYVLESGPMPMPISGATITASNDLNTYSTTSNQVGLYSLENVAEGMYTITCNAEGYAPQVVDNIVVNDGEVVEIDFALIQYINPPTGVTAGYFDFTHTSAAIQWNEPEGVDIDHYEIYRLHEGEETEPGMWTLLDDNVVDTCFLDLFWPELDSGLYEYAVIGYSGYNFSEPAFSNTIVRGFQVVANFRIDGQGEAGALITLINEDINPDYYYQDITPFDGKVTFYDVYQGIYTLTILYNYYPFYELRHISIIQDITCNISFCCDLSPKNLHVDTATMEACWLDPEPKYQTLFKENFEHGYIPTTWQEVFIEDTVSWEIGTGSPSGIPSYAHSGDYNISFSGDSAQTLIMTPPINLANALLPKLIFWYCQSQDTNEWNHLKGYYRNSPGGPWHNLFDSYDNNYPFWVRKVISLPEVTEYYRIAFVAESNNPSGGGICLDDIEVTSALEPDGPYENEDFTGYHLYLDETQLGTYDTAGCHSLGDVSYGFHVAGVWATYFGVESYYAECGFYYYPCDSLAQPQNFHGLVNGMVVTLSWEPPETMKPPNQEYSNDYSRFELWGYYIWKNDRKWAFIPASVNEYTDTIFFPENCYAWEGESYLILRYNVTAVYHEGESCLIDPSFEAICPMPDPPEGLTAEILEGDHVLLTWNPPGNDTGEWIHWDDGENYDSFGLTSGGDFEVASRWEVVDLVPYDGMYLTKIAFYPRGATPEYALKVWTGDTAGILVLDQELSAVVLDQWNTVTLTTPVQIDATQELWFGYAITGQPAGEYPAGYDAGPAIQGKGDMISVDNGEWTTLTALGLDYNWNIWGYVTPEADRYDLLGYNIYLFDEVMAFTEDTFYITPPLFPDTYEYYVTAVYDGGESCKDGPAVVQDCCTSGIQGLVYDARTEKPLSGVTVELGYGEEMITRVDGQYGFYHIGIGTKTVTAEAEGYKPFIQSTWLPSYTIMDLDIRMVDTSLFTFPFVESWDGGAFETQQWTFFPEQVGWQINTMEGHPAPSAQFESSEPMNDYCYSLVSPFIDVLGIESNVILEFDLNMYSSNLTGTEMLTVDVWEGDEWIEIDEFSNATLLEWEHQHYDVTDYAQGKITRIQFTAHGTSIQNIDYWQVDNIIMREAVMRILSGQVLDQYSSPVYATIDVGDLVTYTDENGYFSVHLEEGSYVLSINAEGCLPFTQEVHLENQTYLEIVLPCNLMLVDPMSIYVESFEGYETRYIIIENSGPETMTWMVEIDYLNKNQDITINFDKQSMEWLSLGDSSDIIVPGEIEEIAVNFNGEDLEEGIVYEANIIFTSVPDYGTKVVNVGFMLLTGIGEVDHNDLIRIYPNPSKDYIIIESEQDINLLTITNYIGKTLFETETEGTRYFQINTSGFSNGIYLIRCRMSNGNSVIRKLVINR
ncbi:MAG: carboxypeptidase regulatory-like domain-containing protein [Bacteroidetes bacterium]|nr:carboxypeptidase regulatory-like domain-containing protein [Bacteroidota bacterium]